MTATFTIRIEGLDALKRKLGARWTEPIQAGALAVGEELRNVVATYPGPSHSPVIWPSEKARRWYFANRRAQGLPPKYSRNSDAWSQRLGPSWTVRPDGAMNAVVGTKATYAPWVQSATQQTAQHKATGWITDKEAIERLRLSGKALSIMRAIVQRWISQ